MHHVSDPMKEIGVGVETMETATPTITPDNF